jgi:Tfp pilus assembly protein PilO
MAFDMQLDLGAFLKGLTGRGQKTKEQGTIRSPFQKHVAVGIIIVLLAVVYVALIYLPRQQENRQKQAMIDSAGQLREELLVLDKDISLKKIELRDARNRFEELNRLFHDKQELEDLYRDISLSAVKNELMVVALVKGEEVPIFSRNKPFSGDSFGENMDVATMNEEEDNFQGNGAVEGQGQKKEVAFYQINVKFIFDGNYISYMDFRHDLAQKKKIINIEEETISIATEDQNEEDTEDGTVKITATFSTYRFPSTDAERYVVDEGSMQ